MSDRPQDKLIANELAKEMREHPEAAKELARTLLLSEDYVDWLRYRISTHTLDHKTEALLWNYGFGSPKQTIKVETDQPIEPLAHATPDEIARRAEELVQLAAAQKMTKELAEDLKNSE